MGEDVVTPTDALERALADLRALAQSEATTGDLAYAAGITEAIGRIEQAAEAAVRQSAGFAEEAPTSAAADPDAVALLRRVLPIAEVSYDGDPWFADEAKLDIAAMAAARAYLARLAPEGRSHTVSRDCWCIPEEVGAMLIHRREQS